MTDALDEAVDGPRRLLPQQRFELGEGHLDRVHVRAVGWQVEDVGPALSDRFQHAGYLVRGQVVEDDDVAAPQRWREDVPDVGPEGAAIHRSVEHPWRGLTSPAQPGDEGHRLPVPNGALSRHCFPF